MKLLLNAAAVLLAGAGAAQASTVNLVQNGSFEDFSCDLNRGGFCIAGSTNIDHWIGDPNTEIQTQTTIDRFRSVDLPGVEDGNAYVELDTNQNSTLTQNLVLDAGYYEFSFLYSPRINDGSANTNGLEYALGDLVSGEIFGAPDDDFPHGVWTRYTSSFTVDVDGTAVSLAFAATGASGERGNTGALLDDVRISAVPLPAGALMLLTALAGFGWAGRRRVA